MGAVFTIFLMPLYIIMFLFGGISSGVGAITGTDKTEVALPYDEANGIVWTCDDDEEWFHLEETRIKGDKQIFYFKGNSVFGGAKATVSEVIFKDEKGNKIVYYARSIADKFSFNFQVTMYAPGEYAFVEYTPQERKTYDDAWWETPYAKSNYLETIEKDGVKTFKYVCFCDENFVEDFRYKTNPPEGKPDTIENEYERLTVEFKVKNGEAKVIRETREIKTESGCWIYVL
ncbi:MAG: hypothetical protein IJ279_08425 [Clostridia bacterium]|nr:hypothetical protein [Clostridia bacterium]